MLDHWYATRPRKLLVTTDLDAGGTTALRLGCRWAWSFGADVAACHVVSAVTADDQPDVASTLAHAVSQVRASFDMDEGAAERLELIVSSGDPRRKVVEAAETCSADLVVVGAAPRKLGTVAEAVLESACCDVLVARPPSGRGPVIAACDLSESSLAAVATAKAVAVRFDAPLVVVHALTFGRAAGLAPEREEALVATRDGLAAALAGIGVEAELRIADRAASVAILALERQLAARLVVVGARGISRTPRRALGSVAHEVARTAGSSVLVVRAIGGAAS
jgi:nucleotide-binding universal stress UspA family protein